VRTIYLDPAPPNGGHCVGQAPETWDAYAIVAGLSPPALRGSWFLIDPQGWLRSAHGPGEAPPAPKQLAAELDTILSHPLAATVGGVHVHHH
jgi:hypothetical protein